MKKTLAILLSSVLIFSLAGCITIIHEDPSKSESNAQSAEASSEPTEETRAETNEEPSTEAPTSEVPSETEDEGGHHEIPEPTTDESGMRYSYTWLKGYYKTLNTTPDSEYPEWIPNCEVLFYENGLFAARGDEYGYHEGYIGSYIIIDDTIYLHPWFMTGGGVGSQAVKDTEFIMGINMDQTLISGTYYLPNMVLIKGTESDAEAFDKENGVDSILHGSPLYNDFYSQHPEAF